MNDNNPVKIIFLGTPEFCLPVLQFLNNNSFIDLCLVVSMPDRPAGRGNQLKSPAVIEYCKEKQISFLQTKHLNSDVNATEAIKSLKPDILLVLAFAQFLSKDVLNIPKRGCFNIHTSLLPRWRGAAPIQHALLNNDRETGISIQRMVSKMDAGDVCIEKRLPIRAYDNQISLTTRLQFACVEALEEFILHLSNNSLNFQVQNDHEITLAPEIKKDDGKIDFKRETAINIYHKYRAYTFWPGLFTFINEKRLKLIKMRMITHPSHGLQPLSPGIFFEYQGMLAVQTRDGILRLEQIQWEGKKPVWDYEFLRSNKAAELNQE